MDPNVTEKQETTTTVRETMPVTPAPAAPQVDPQRVPSSVLAARVIYYIGGAIILLLALRLVLALLGANRDNPFADFIFGSSYPFAYPFFGLFSYEPAYGVSVLELSTLVAMIVYAIATAGIAKLFTLGRRDV